MKKIVKASVDDIDLNSDISHMLDYLSDIIYDLQTNGIDDLTSRDQKRVYDTLREIYRISGNIETILSNYSS